MKSFLSERFFSKWRWQLAAGIVAVYLPIRIFVSNDVFTAEIVRSKAVLWTAEVLVNILFFRFWISVIEGIEYFFNWIHTSFKLRIPQRFFTYITGIGLAFLFNIAFFFFWVMLATFLNKHLDITVKRSGEEMTLYNRRQKAKGNTALTVMAMVATVYMVSEKKSNARLELARVRAERLERERLQTRFLALKGQLSPHFLFNSLSILTSMIERKPEESVKYVNRLARSYRYILDHTDHETVTLKTELDFVESYIFLLKARFEEKVEVRINVPAEVRHGYRIAPLTLQLLIENAVKHNRMSLEHPLTIDLFLEQNYLVVANPLRKRPNDDATPGVGLQNVVHRYELLTEHPVVRTETSTDFTVKIPLLT